MSAYQRWSGHDKDPDDLGDSRVDAAANRLEYKRDMERFDEYKPPAVAVPEPAVAADRPCPACRMGKYLQCEKCMGRGSNAMSWRGRHWTPASERGEACAVCNGAGYYDCPTCGGAGVLPPENIG